MARICHSRISLDLVAAMRWSIQNTRTTLWLRILLGIVGIISQTCLAQSGSLGPHEQVRTSLVKIIVTAKASQDGTGAECGRCTVKRVGTGFFISEDGLVATSHHITNGFSGLVPNSLRFQVVYETSQGSKSLNAEVDAINARRDILILKAQTKGFRYPFLRTLRRPGPKVVLSKTPVFTSGYPDGYGYATNNGYITAKEGPTGHLYLWVTNMGFKSGQSGSPVYLDSGHLIGIVKGSEQQVSHNNFIVPIRYLRSLNLVQEEDLPRPGDGQGSERSNSPKPSKEPKSAFEEEIIEVFLGTGSGNVETRTRTKSFVWRNDHCEAPRIVTGNIEASEGWTIRESSVSVYPTVVSSKSSFFGTRELEAKRIAVQGLVRNSGRCIFGRGDGRGTLVINVKYVEERSLKKEPTLLFKGALSKSKKLTVPISFSELQSVRITFTKRSDTETLVFNTLGQGSNSFFSVHYNFQKQVLELSKKSN